ncbi:MAG: hypothetical protein C4303_03450 [candidate division GAL15 bacterium]
MHILRFLRVQRGLVARTKRDLVDEEWLALVTDSLAAYHRAHGLPFMALRYFNVCGAQGHEGQPTADLLRARLAVHGVEGEGFVRLADH